MPSPMSMMSPMMLAWAEGAARKIARKAKSWVKRRAENVRWSLLVVSGAAAGRLVGNESRIDQGGAPTHELLHTRSPPGPEIGPSCEAVHDPRAPRGHCGTLLAR